MGGGEGLRIKRSRGVNGKQFSLYAVELAAFGCMLPVSRKSSVCEMFEARSLVNPIAWRWI